MDKGDKYGGTNGKPRYVATLRQNCEKVKLKNCETNIMIFSL